MESPAPATLLYPPDPRWEAVDTYARDRLLAAACPSPYLEAIQYAGELSAEAGLPNMDVSPLQGKFLQLQCKIAKATHVLEVGTMGGVSSIWLASSSPRVKVMSVYTDPRRKAIADRALYMAGLGDRVEVLSGEGTEVLPVIRMYVENGHREKFGFVFIDSEKEHCERYLWNVIPMCKENAVIIIDNIVQNGALADDATAKTDAEVEGARKVVEAAGKDPRLESTLVQTVGGSQYDGFLMCVVVKPKMEMRGSSFHQHCT